MKNEPTIERIGTRPLWTIRRFLSALVPPREAVEEFAKFVKDPDSFNPYNVSRFKGNLLLNEGIAVMHNLMFSTGGTKWDNTNARIGVGDDNTAADPTDTGLQAAVNKLWKAMEATYPTYAAQVTTFRSVFGSSEANYAWEEFTVVNAADDTGDNLNRKVEAEGTKTAGQTWTVDLAITWS
jgi:hypothetical protein